jgi:4-hydroxy-3-methylbut-2-enyl diphosphate reductase
MSEHDKRTVWDQSLTAFQSSVVDAVMAGPTPGVLHVAGNQIVLPEVFGFCRGVKRAIAMVDDAIEHHGKSDGEIVLLGEIIHNPWVNEYFRRRGVRVLTRDELADLPAHVSGNDCAIIPAFGLLPEWTRQLQTIGSTLIDCSCGDVIRVWQWGEREVSQGFGVLIFGRAKHDETLVTRSRLAEHGGKYLIVQTLDEARVFSEIVAGQRDESELVTVFGPAQTNADSLEPLLKLAQVSQTTMLHSETQKVCQVLADAFTKRFGSEAEQRLRFQPTVCRATQDRQDAAVKLCREEFDVVIVIGGFGSSNTQHLWELAQQHSPAWLVEDADAIRSADELFAWDAKTQSGQCVAGWLPDRRPLRVGLLAGASSPEIVIGDVLKRLAECLE